MRYDVFISQASEDKDKIATPLYAMLTAKGVSVWFDEAVLEIGDSLRRKIDDGLARCRYGIVILSPHFLAKQWPQRELDGLLARETATGKKAILPVWHELDAAILVAYSPPLADRLAVRSEEGLAAGTAAPLLNFLHFGSKPCDLFGIQGHAGPPESEPRTRLKRRQLDGRSHKDALC
jgi:hypothetical protein